MAKIFNRLLVHYTHNKYIFNGAIIVLAGEQSLMCEHIEGFKSGLPNLLILKLVLIYKCIGKLENYPLPKIILSTINLINISSDSFTHVDHSTENTGI